MEYLTNSCEYNERNLTEANRVQMELQNRKKNLFFYGFIVLLLLLCLYLRFTQGDSKYSFYAGLCLLTFGMLLHSTRQAPRRAARLQVPRIQEKNGGLRFRVQFREQSLHILGPTGEESSSVAYSELERIAESAHLILLFTGERHMIVLDQDGFEGGSAADFRKLLEEKCPRLAPLPRA